MTKQRKKKTSPSKLYKFLRFGMKSDHGDCQWKLNEWQTTATELELCYSGFHASLTPLDALGYVKGEILAIVEVKGKKLTDSNKSCHSSMRVIKAYNWNKRDFQDLSIFAAELALPLFEKKHPQDKRPREAIEAAKVYIEKPTAENLEKLKVARKAANDACYAAVAVYAAYYVSVSVSVSSAASYAAVAAYHVAARKKIKTQINKWIIARMKKLEAVA